MPYTYNYPRPALTVDSIVFRENSDETEVLLVQRKNPPYKGYWAFPGGFVEIDESSENAVKRELTEETGLTGVRLKQLYTFSEINRDPRGRTVSIVYYGFVDLENSGVAGSSDAAYAKWFSINNLPPLAFDHTKILAYAIGKFDLY